MKTKKCNKCLIEKSIKDFYSDKDKKDGLATICISCKKKYYQKYQKPLRYEKYKDYIKRNPIFYIYSVYRRGAKHRGYIFKLSERDVGGIVSQPCYYCGELQENFNGIDRLDNNEGYIKSNCVPCCSICNIMKHTKTKKEFIEKCKQITKKQEVMSYSK